MQGTVDGHAHALLLVTAANHSRVAVTLHETIIHLCEKHKGVQVGSKPCVEVCGGWSVHS